jgi:hypothetical protein
MSEPQLDTSRLHALVRRIRAGDAAARDELLRPIIGRLERPARRMLARFPDGGRWEQSGAVLGGDERTVRRRWWPPAFG